MKMKNIIKSSNNNSKSWIKDFILKKKKFSDQELFSFFYKKKIKIQITF